LVFLDDMEGAGTFGFADSFASDGTFFPAATMLIHERDQLLPGKSPGGNGGDIRSHVAALEIGMHLIALESLDALHGAEDAVGQRMAGKMSALGRVVGRPHRLV